MSPEEPLPFFLAGSRVGEVQNVTRIAAHHRGILILYDDIGVDLSEFQTAVALAQQADEAPGTEIYAAYHAWESECDTIRAAGVRIGDPDRPIEYFSMNSNWSIEWEYKLPENLYVDP